VDASFVRRLNLLKFCFIPMPSQYWSAHLLLSPLFCLFLSSSKSNLQEPFTMLSSSSRIAIARSSLIRSNASVMHASQQQQQQQQQQRFKNANVTDESSQSQHEFNFFPIYVHPVSKIALQHLTANQSDWLVEKGLDRGLRFNPNGTFVLNFPAPKGSDAGRIWYVETQLQLNSTEFK
jgi:hypothetical protein